jgi:UDP-perosamine 4-acetyltransferase
MTDRHPEYCAVLGGGGHAAVLIEALRARGTDIAKAVLDSDPSSWGKEVLGVPVVGGDDLLSTLRDRGADSFIVGLGTTGTGDLRRRLFDYGRSCGLEPLSVFHPSAVISPSATLGQGCQVLAGAIVNTRAVLGNNVLVNSGAIVEHDCRVGDDVHIATGAQLAGGVTVGNSTLIGAGATVRQCIRIGKDVVVGAGAVVVQDVPDRATVAGVPARALTAAAKRGPQERVGGEDRW